MDPLLALVESLEAGTGVPLGWRERHARNGDLAVLWSECERASLLLRIVVPPEDHWHGVPVAAACAHLALELASFESSAWSKMLEHVETGADFADNVLDEAEDLYERAEAAGFAPVTLIAMSTVVEALRAGDLQQGVPRDAAIFAVDRAAQVEALASTVRPFRVLATVRRVLRCPSLDAVVEAYRTAQKTPP